MGDWNQRFFSTATKKYAMCTFLHMLYKCIDVQMVHLQNILHRTLVPQKKNLYIWVSCLQSRDRFWWEVCLLLCLQVWPGRSVRLSVHREWFQPVTMLKTLSPSLVLRSGFWFSAPLPCRWAHISILKACLQSNSNCDGAQADLIFRQ